MRARFASKSARLENVKVPLALVDVVLSHQPPSTMAPARSMCLAMVKSKFCAAVNCRPVRMPDCPAPPDVNASSTRIVGAAEVDVSVVCACVSSTRSSLNSFLPIVRVLRTRSVSLVVSFS